MKWIAITFANLTIILAALYLVIGGPVLAIALATIGLIAIVIGMFSLGIWYAHKSIRLGAKLAIEAQNNNDHWDTVKMQSLAQFGSDMIKLKSLPEGSAQSALGIGHVQDAFDASFTITGIDSE